MAKTSHAAIPSSELSLCRHCHPADGAFNSRGTLVHAISPNVLTEVSKEVKKSEIASRYQASMVRNHQLDYIICLSLVAVLSACRLGAATKFKTMKIEN